MEIQAVFKTYQPTNGIYEVIYSFFSCFIRYIYSNSFLTVLIFFHLNKSKFLRFLQ